MSNTYLGPKGPISVEEAARVRVLAYGATPYPDQVTAFESVDELRKWVDGTDYKDGFARAMASVEVAREGFAKDPGKVLVMQQAAVKEVGRKMEELARETGLDPNSRDLFLRATVDPDPLRGPIFRSAQVFDGPGCTGQRLDIPSWRAFPNLGFFGFNDRASSVRVHSFSSLLLCEHVNYAIEGRWTFFFGGLWWSNSFDLEWPLNNGVSSCYCFGR
jgi:hypothetical protein